MKKYVSIILFLFVFLVPNIVYAEANVINNIGKKSTDVLITETQIGVYVPEEFASVLPPEVTEVQSGIYVPESMLSVLPPVEEEVNTFELYPGQAKVYKNDYNAKPINPTKTFTYNNNLKNVKYTDKTNNTNYTSADPIPAELKIALDNTFNDKKAKVINNINQ